MPWRIQRDNSPAIALAPGATMVAPMRWLVLSASSFTKPNLWLYNIPAGISVILTIAFLYLRSRFKRSSSFNPTVITSGEVLIILAKPR